MKKRFLSTLVALALCFSILPAGAFAANGTASAAEGQAETGMVQTPTGEWTSGVRAANTCYQNFTPVELSGADAGDASGTDTDDDPGSGTNTDSEPSADVPV